jgi:AcrR family transcriptional regulator
MSVRAVAHLNRTRESQIRLPAEQREAELLAAARPLLRETGYENFLLAELARRCQVSEALVYRYFPTKRELLARVAEEWLADILAQEPDLSTCADTEERLRRVIAYGLQVVRAEPALTRYILLELRADPNFRDTAVYRLNRGFTNLVVRVLEQAIAEGEFRRDVPVALMRDTIFGAIEHRTWAYLRGDGDFSVAETATGLAAVICGGMRVSPVRAARRRASTSTR